MTTAFHWFHFGVQRRYIEPKPALSYFNSKSETSVFKYKPRLGLNQRNTIQIIIIYTLHNISQAKQHREV